MSQTNQTTIRRGNQQLTISVRNGFSLEQVVALMNNHTARVQGREIVAFCEPPAEGFYTVADVLSQTDSTPTANGPWTVLGSADTLTACAGRCDSCKCKCACGVECCK